MSYYRGTFLVGAHLLGVPFENYKRFLEYLGLTTVSYGKTIQYIFVSLFLCEVTTTKVNLCFNKQCSQAVTRLLYRG